MKDCEKSDSLWKWAEIMQLDCQTEKKINIKSYGDWNFSLSCMEANKVNRPMIQLVRQKNSHYYGCIEEQDLDQNGQVHIQVQEFPQFQDIKQALNNITVQIQMSEQQFRQKYGFWEIKNFKVYQRDGNSSSCSFQAGDKLYYGSYGTS